MSKLLESTQLVPLISLRDIKRTFVTGGGVEVHALRGVSLDIYAGEFVSLIGQSGSGKSTMMNILGCLDRPTAGDYIFAGNDIRSFDANGLAWLRREAFGFVFQSLQSIRHCQCRRKCRSACYLCRFIKGTKAVTLI